MAIAYIPRFSVFPYLVKGDRKFLTKNWVHRIVEKGYTKAEEEDCFWTDAYFHILKEMDRLLNEFSIEIVDHVGTNGLGPLLNHIVDDMTNSEYEAWIEYHLSTCREESIIGCSNHALYICRKV